jgi:hypothetical protein
MSYIAPHSSKLEIAVFNWVSAGLNVDATLTLMGSSWATAPDITTGRVTLPPGHYRFCAAVGLTRANASYNVRFAVQSYDGATYTSIGSDGQSDLYYTAQGNTDLAEGVLTVPLGSTIEVTVRVLQIENVMPTIVADDSTFVIWRTSL